MKIQKYKKSGGRGAERRRAIAADRAGSEVLVVVGGVGPVAE